MSSPSVMKVAVYGADNEFYQEFRNTLLGIGIPQLVAEQCQSQSRSQDFDLVVWDVDEFLTKHNLIPSSRPSRELFAVSRKNARRFLADCPRGTAQIALKPVSRTVLKVFLETGLRMEPESSAPTQALLESSLRLQEYEQDRTHFLERAVHDFRDPLTAAIGSCGLLKDQVLGPLNDEQINVLGRMQRSLDKLARMTSAMLQLSGKHLRRLLQLEEADIEDVVNKAVQEIAPFAAEKRISVTVDLARSEWPLEIAGDKIEQVLFNLLENGCKFTPRGGEVEVRGYPANWEGSADKPIDASAYRIDVADTGAVILPEHLDSVLEDYTSYSGHDRSGGGMAMALSKMIVSHHGGRIWAESHSRGTMFSFILPVKKSNAGAAAGMTSKRREPEQHC